MQKYAFAVEVPTLLDIYCEGFGAHLAAFFNPFSRFSLQSFFNCIGLKPKAIKKRISTAIRAIFKTLGFFLSLGLLNGDVS